MELIEQKGKVTWVGKREEVGAKNHPKQSIAISFQDGKYDADLCVEFFGQSVEKLTEVGATVGDEVGVKFRVKSRYWESGDKWFTTASGVFIDKLSSADAPPSGEALDEMPF